MLTLLVNLALMMIWAAILDPAGSRFGRKAFTFLCVIQWVALSGLRAHDVGSDTFGYELYFNRYLFYPFDEVWTNFIGEYFFIGDGSLNDGGYYLFMKLFQLVCDSYQLWLIVLAVAFFVPMGLLVYRYSEDPFLSWMLFSTVFYTFFAFSAMRQALALSIGVFIGFQAIKSKRPLLFILLVFLAFTMHKSSLVVAPMYVVYWRVFNRKAVTIYVIVAVLCLLLRNQIIQTAGMVFEEYAHYASGYVGANTVFYSVMLVGFAGLLKWRGSAIASLKSADRGLYHMLACSIVVIPVAFVNSNVFRAAYYYMIFLILLFPMFLAGFPPKESRFVSLIAIAAMLVFMVFIGPVNDGAEYHFFWTALH